MTDTTQPNAAPNPASVASNPNPAASQNNPNATRDAGNKDALARDPATQRAAHEPVTVGEGKQTRSSTLVTNPRPTEPDVPAEEPIDTSGLPQGTIDEMAAGKKALERNRPVAQALEEARADNDKKPS